MAGRRELTSICPLWDSSFLSEAFVLSLFSEFFFVHKYFAYMRACASHMCLVPLESQKRTSESMELQLQMVIACRMGAEN